MLHPGLHGYRIDQRQRELERAAQRERLIAEARSVATNRPNIGERTLLLAGSLLISFGQRLCTHYPTEPQRALMQTPAHDTALSPLSMWTPAMLARIRNATEGGPPITFVYYGFVTAGSHGITRTEYVTPLAHPVASGRLDARKGG